MGTDEGREVVGWKHETGWGEGGRLCLEWRRENKKEEIHCVLAALLYIKSHRGVERIEFWWQKSLVWTTYLQKRSNIFFFFIRFGVFNFNEIITYRCWVDYYKKLNFDFMLSKWRRNLFGVGRDFFLKNPYKISTHIKVTMRIGNIYQTP